MANSNDNDLIDEKGHTVEQAKKQQRLFDASAPAATEEAPKGDKYVASQTPDEVQAQVDNVPGAVSDDDEDRDPDRS